jgi:hypothetical protein
MLHAGNAVNQPNKVGDPTARKRATQNQRNHKLKRCTRASGSWDALITLILAATSKPPLLIMLPSTRLKQGYEIMCWLKKC